MREQEYIDVGNLARVRVAIYALSSSLVRQKDSEVVIINEALELLYEAEEILVEKTGGIEDEAEK